MSKRVWLGLSIGSVVAALIGGGAYLVLRGGTDSQATAQENGGGAPNAEQGLDTTENVPTPIPLPAEEFGSVPSYDPSPASQFPSSPAAESALPGEGETANEAFSPQVQFAAADPEQRADEYMPMEESPTDGEGTFRISIGDDAYATAGDSAADEAAPMTQLPYADPSVDSASDGSPVANSPYGMGQSPPLQTEGAAIPPYPNLEEQTAGSPVENETAAPQNGYETAQSQLPEPPVESVSSPEAPSFQAPSFQVPVPVNPQQQAAPLPTLPSPIGISDKWANPSETQPDSQPTGVPAGASPGSATIAPTLAADTPGPEQLDGEQTPALSLERVAPQEIQVGKKATFETLVRNVGQVSAHNVVVTDRIPQGTQLVDASPQFTQTADGAILWELGSLEPGDETLIALQLMPQAEGEIGSVAEVSFQARASVRSICTKPELMVEHTAPNTVMVGDNVAFDITITNSGTGAATGVMLEEDVPPGLTHPSGRELMNEIGTLLPGESRRLELVLTAEAAGAVSNVLRVRGEGDLFAEHRTQLEVIAPQLQIALSGPTRRYLDRQVTYQIGVANPGTAVATNVEIVTYLPPGLRFIATDDQVQYDQQNHAVFWSLAELSPNEQGAVQLTALPIETGDQQLVVEGRADLDLHQQYEHTTVVEGITKLQFSITDVQDPIEVNSETTYEVRVVNTGSKPATNVLIGAALSAGATALDGEGPTRVTIDGQQVVTEPLSRLDPGAEALYRLRVRGDQAGDHIVRVQMASDDTPTPVTKEESTRVYADE